MNIRARIWSSSQTVNRIVDLATGLIWSGRNGLAPQLAARRDVSAQNGQIICSRQANPITVQADFEGDHASGERRTEPWRPDGILDAAAAISHPSKRVSIGSSAWFAGCFCDIGLAENPTSRLQLAGWNLNAIAELCSRKADMG